MARITVTIGDDLYEQLRAVAAVSNRSLSNLVASLLSDLGAMLTHVLESRTAGELSSYLDGMMAEREKDAAQVRQEILSLVEDRHDELAAPPPKRRRPPPSNTGVRK